MIKGGDTYYALASPAGRSAISTIRISGPKALLTVKNISNRETKDFTHRKSVFVNIYNENNDLIDNCIVVWYRAPNSYTGEELVEIHTHGNPKIIQNIYIELGRWGLRLAEPGEFTRTAYLNNKLDLIQAEAVSNLINSQSDHGIRLSLNNISGNLSSRLVDLKKTLIDSLVHIEYELDISENDSYTNTIKYVTETVNGSLLFIKTLLETHRSAKVLSDGARVVIVGAPNAGKSTLFNSLLSYDRAIVTSTPGTTRDSIEGALYISNYSILLVDTAGIRKARNKIELAGIKKTNNEIQNADLIYCVIDSTKKKKEPIEKAGAPIIYVYNKADLLNDEHIHNIKKTREEGVVISAKTKVGISRLKQKTSELLQKKFVQKNGFYITSARQQAVLKNIETILNRTLFLDTIKELELVAVDLKLAIEQFDWLLGKTTADDILNSIFSDFCVGK